MTHYYAMPLFLGIDSAFEVLEGLIALFIGIYAHKIYGLTKQRRYLFLSTAFYLLTASFFTAALTNYFSYEEWVSAVSPWVKLTAISTIYRWGFIAHVALFTSGIVTLAILAFDLKERRTMGLFYLLALAAIIMSLNIYLMAHFVSILLLAFIVPHFYRNYAKKKSINTHIVFLAFALLFFAHAFFLLVYLNPAFYFVSHITQLASFALLLVGLVRTFRK